MIGYLRTKAPGRLLGESSVNLRVSGLSVRQRQAEALPEHIVREEIKQKPRTDDDRGLTVGAEGFEPPTLCL